MRGRGPLKLLEQLRTGQAGTAARAAVPGLATCASQALARLRPQVWPCTTNVTLPSPAGRAFKRKPPTVMRRVARPGLASCGFGPPKFGSWLERDSGRSLGRITRVPQPCLPSHALYFESHIHHRHYVHCCQHQSWRSGYTLKERALRLRGSHHGVGAASARCASQSARGRQASALGRASGTGRPTKLPNEQDTA